LIQDKLKIGLYILFIFICFTCFVNASEKNSNVYLDKVIVTDNSTEKSFQTGDVRADEVSAFSSVITRESFEGKVEDLSEVIEKEAGVQVRQSGGLGSFSTVSLRGSSSDQVLIFVDGIRLNEASGGGVDISNIALADVEKIEIYRGATPLNFGTASIGGVINIKTRRSKKGVNASVTAGYGSFTTVKGAAFINHKPGRFDYLVTADYQGSKNDFKYNNDKGIDQDDTYSRWESRYNNQFERMNLLTKLGYDFSDKFRLDVSNQFFTKKQGLPNWRNSSNVSTEYRSSRNISIVKFVADKITPLQLKTSTRLDFSYKTEDYDDTNYSIGVGQEQHLKYKTSEYGFNHFVEWATDFNVVSAVVDARREHYEIENLIDNEIYHPSWRNTFSGAVEDMVMLFDETLFLSPSLRYHLMRDELKSMAGAVIDPKKIRSETNQYFSPKIGLRYQPFNWLTVKSNYGKYVREPSFMELFGDRGFFNGNEFLVAEEGLNFDAGVELAFRFKNPYISSISLKGIYFNSQVDNLIAFIYDATGVGKAFNIDRASINGIETGVGITFFKYLSLTSNYTWQDVVNRGKIDISNGKKLPGRFEHSFFGKLEFKNSLFSVCYETVYEDGMYYDDVEILKVAEKFENNIGASVYTCDFKLTFEAKNIFNNWYEDFKGYPQPGRSYYLTLKYNI